MTPTYFRRLRANMKALGLALVICGGMAQYASADIVVTAKVSQSLGMTYNFTTATTTSVEVNGGGDLRASVRNNHTATPPTASKTWVQFDLGSIWAANPQSNLLSASLTLWSNNGTTRVFDVYGLAESAGLDNWSNTAIVQWANGPANVAPDNTDATTRQNTGHQFDSTKVFGGAPIWQVRSSTLNPSGTAVPSLPGTIGVYTSTLAYAGSTADFTNFLLTDSDGKVTLMMSGSAANNNAGLYIGNDGSNWASLNLTNLSPTLTLTFSEPVAVPEPSMLTLLGPVIAGVSLVRRNRKINL